jgi:NO-binding membrane sensor protein with MHYT domain
MVDLRLHRHGDWLWSMHFTGVLAFSLPVPVSYYWPDRTAWFCRLFF